MSYFSMAIITKDKPTEEMIEKIMAPYQNVGVGSFPPAEYRKFIADPSGCWDEEEQECGYWENPLFKNEQSCLIESIQAIQDSILI